jgi:tripartite-type tricarboxylate transporter receptor subunit TctC
MESMYWRMVMLRTLAHILAAAVLACIASAAGAQGWPARPVTMVVPFAAGTASDVVARALVDDLSRAIGQPITVDNRGGAGGNIGAAAVAKAKPDGYTILLATTGPAATNKLMYKSLSFDPQRDFADIVLVGKAPVIIVARSNAPVSSLFDTAA